MRKAQVIGILYVDCHKLFNTLSQEDAAFTAAVAGELGVRIENFRLQQQAIKNERMAAIGMTITNLAHNIKNLLMLNQNAVDLMHIHLKNLNNEKISRSWELIQQSFTRINTLSVEMLEYARAPSLQLKQCDINALVLANRDFYAQSLKNKGIRLRLNLSKANPVWLMDPAQFQRALVNLVVNAIDALENREKASIEIKTEVPDRQRLIVRVIDNGCGIDTAQQHKIFDLFFATKGTGGSGLGLPMVRQFIERMGGALQVKSKKDVGTSFKMVFPKLKAQLN